MKLFDPADTEIPEPDLNPERVRSMIQDIRRNDRNRRVALMAPFVLAVAVIGTMFVTPSRYGGLDWVPEAGAVDEELPRVFGSNGVWRRAAPIAENTAQTPLARTETIYKDPKKIEHLLRLPTLQERNSLPVSTSPPPALILGQIEQDKAPKRQLPIILSQPKTGTESATGQIEAAADPEIGENAKESQTDLQQSQAVTAPETEPVTSIEPNETADNSGVLDISDIKVEPIEAEPPLVAAEPASHVEPNKSETALAGQQIDLTPVGSSEPDPTTQSQQSDDVRIPSVDGVSQPTDGNELEQVAPSTPVSSSEPNFEQMSNATLLRREVMVRSAHVTVVVDLIAEEHSVIDWCSTWVDWGDNSVTRAAGSGQDSTCAAQCEQVESSPGAGISMELLFSHEYAEAADISPIVHVSTGSSCDSVESSTLQLAAFSVAPY